MSRLYCLLDLGIRVEKEESIGLENTFTYKKEHFQLITSKVASVRKFISDIQRCKEFFLEIRTNHTDPDTHYLSVFFDVRSEQPFYTVNKHRIVTQIFDMVDPELTADETPMDSSPASVERLNEVQMLYNRLKQAHAKCAESEKNVDLESYQHPMLRALLRPYQAKAVQWMINRETVPVTFNIPLIQLTTDHVLNQTFYMDRYTWKIFDSLPSPRMVPAGGLLCDEMGLGKTVEMLSLILHRRQVVEPREDELLDEEFKKQFVFNKMTAKKLKLHCICIGKSSVASTVLCNKCKRLQHVSCVLKHTKYKRSLTEYMCPDCWQRYGTIVESHATLIVSPLSIKQQWKSEITKHVCDKNFRVFVYEGVKNTGWISPTEMAKFDVVLTDYNVLTSEIFFTSINQRTLRNERKHANPVSPLPFVHWYRSCLDEAQMIETPTTQSARMVNSLPAQYRWSVTGTPIEKDISSLYGLIYFLGYEPYSASGVWKHFIEQYRSGSITPLIDLLQKVMWRTCKIDVIDELKIPLQSELVHYVSMTNLQNFFYRNEHAQYQRLFYEKSAKLMNNQQLTVSRMNAHTLKLLMEPLRKLRLDCNVPSVFQRNNAMDQATKKLLSPAQLHDHLISTTEIEFKTCLRTIASSLNGIAACFILRNNFQEAAKSYQKVLKLASEYNEKKIHVDTLLQIHAVHNLLEIHKEIDEAIDHLTFESKLCELEWKYIEPYKDKVKEVETRLISATKQFKEIGKNELSQRGDTWWRQVLYDTQKEDVLIDKILLDLKSNGFDLNAYTVRGVDMVLTTWIDKVKQSRRTIIRLFMELEYFHGNLKPKTQLTEDELLKIDYLVKTAYDCHLFVADNDSDTEAPEPASKNKRSCQMCRVKSKLNDYECEIFNKQRFGDEEIRGSWNPCMQEYIFKTILSFAKRETFDQEIIKEGEIELKFIESLKNEFKEYSQYWVEINYTVSAYDELNMCKSRLEGIDMNEENAPAVMDARLTNMRIPIHMVDVILEEMTAEKNNAEMNFTRTQGRLKYLHHLKSENEVDVCPICKQKPEEKYSVLLCGHLMCYICTTQMARFQRNSLTCAVCRHHQSCKDVLFVTLDEAASIEIEGSYASKVTRIVKEILKITKNEPDVKIVIFSQWENILYYISDALKTNKISYITRTYSRAHDQIEDFKDYKKGITCLLLPLAFGSKGLNLTEATHVFLVEPILDPSEELQAIGRIHRIGQTRPTFVHRFIVKNTIEEKIYKTVTNDRSGIWTSKNVTIEDLRKLFDLDTEMPDEMNLNQSTASMEIDYE